jgi:tetratricopeptide (TPR) repeat protein
MATQESNLRDQEAGERPRRSMGNEKLSMVVDRPSPTVLGLLILPFSTVRGEEAVGRQIGLLVQQRLGQLADLAVGHGLLVATSPDRRRYLPLYHPLSTEQALSCGVSWRAAAVLSGSIVLQPNLRWTLTLRAVQDRSTLFEDTLVGDTEDLLDAPGDVAITMANALGITLVGDVLKRVEQRETQRLDALLMFLAASDLREQHGVTEVNPRAARAQMLQAAALDPTFRAPLERLAADLINASGDGSVIEELLAAMENLGQDGVVAMEGVARVLEEDGHSEQSASVATAILGIDANRTTSLALAGQHAYRSGHFARARRIVQSLLDIDPENAAPYALLGNVLAAGNRIPGAAIQWELAIEYDPNQPKVLLRLGAYLATLGEHKRALEILEMVDEQGASTADSLYQLGVAAYRLGMLDRAVEALERAVVMNEDLPYVHIMLARCYARAGQDELSLAQDRKAIALSPSYWPSALAIGYVELNQGNIAEALAAYTEVARARPDLPEALYGLGIALVANNMLDDGLASLVRAYELDRQNVGILCALTLTYLKTGALEDAQATLYDALLLAPDNPDVAHCMEQVHRFSVSA